MEDEAVDVDHVAAHTCPPALPRLPKVLTQAASTSIVPSLTPPEITFLARRLLRGGVSFFTLWFLRVLTANPPPQLPLPTTDQDPD
jgi:hypothetical protein